MNNKLSTVFLFCLVFYESHCADIISFNETKISDNPETYDLICNYTIDENNDRITLLSIRNKQLTIQCNYYGNGKSI